MKELRAVLVLAAVLTFPALLFAGTDFSGTWRLNADESDFGMFPAPDKMTYHISHQDSKLVIVWDFAGGDRQMNGTATYPTDGSGVMNTFGKLQLTSKARWDGDVLKVKSWGDMGGNRLEFKDWFILESPNRLRVKRLVDGPGGTTKQLMVFDKVTE